MATPPSTSSKSTKRTLARSSGARAASSAGSAHSSKPPQPEKAPASTSTWSENTPSDDLLVVAQVLAPHGIRGELKCRIVTDFPKQRFKRGNSVLLDGETRVVQSARIQGQVVLLRLEGITDRTAAEKFR